MTGEKIYLQVPAGFGKYAPKSDPGYKVLFGDSITATRSPLSDDELRGYKAIAEYRYGGARYWRRVCHVCAKGRFPFYRDGSTICARKSTLDRLIALQEYYALIGREWTTKDVSEHFGPSGNAPDKHDDEN